MNRRSDLPTMVFIDFETSGLDPVNDRPLEVCAVRVVEGEITSVFNTLVYYTGQVTEAMKKFSKHTLEDLRKGMSEEWVAVMLNAMIGPGDVVVAYNVLFDLQFMEELFNRNWETIIGEMNASMVGDYTVTNPFIDPLTIAREHYPYPHKLGDMCDKLGITLEEAHTAYDDTLALVDLTLRLHDEHDILKWVNVAGYKAQYGEPQWYPAHATLKPQGNVTVYHTEGGQTVKTKSVKPNLRKAVK